MYSLFAGHDPALLEPLLGGPEMPPCGRLRVG